MDARNLSDRTKYPKLTIEQKLERALVEKRAIEDRARAKRKARAAAKRAKWRRRYMRKYIRRWRKLQKSKAYQKRRIELVLQRATKQTVRDILERCKALRRMYRLGREAGLAAGWNAKEPLNADQARLHRKAYRVAFAEMFAERQRVDALVAKTAPEGFQF